MSTNKTIFITGSSSGIGRACVRHFQGEGWNVVATMRNPQAETELNLLNNVHVARVDVRDIDSLSIAVEKGIEEFGKIDVLLNNAGFGAYGPLEATSLEGIDRQFETNVLGLIYSTRTLIPHFRKNKSGTVVNVGSMVGKAGVPLGSLYNSTKFAVEGFSEALSYEMDAIGVKVKLIEPGSVKTDFAGRSLHFSNDESLTEYQDLIQNVLYARGNFRESGIMAERVAQTIYDAVTDETDRLRYPVGPDADFLLSERKRLDDSDFMDLVRQTNGLS